MILTIGTSCTMMSGATTATTSSTARTSTTVTSSCGRATTMERRCRTSANSSGDRHVYSTSVKRCSHRTKASPHQCVVLLTLSRSELQSEADFANQICFTLHFAFARCECNLKATFTLNEIKLVRKNEILFEKETMYPIVSIAHFCLC